MTIDPDQANNILIALDAELTRQSDAQGLWYKRGDGLNSAFATIDGHYNLDEIVFAIQKALITP